MSDTKNERQQGSDTNAEWRETDRQSESERERERGGGGKGRQT